MEKIFIKDNKTSRSAILLWNYLFNNRDASNQDASDFLKNLDVKFSNIPWIVDGKTFSCVGYCIKKLQEYGCLEINEQIRDADGRYSHTVKSFLKEPLIKEVIPAKVLCSECGSSFNRKLAKAKIQDLCHACTQELYMTSKTVICDLCEEELKMNYAYGHMHKFYHEDCKKIIIEKSRAQTRLVKERRLKALANNKCKKCNSSLAGSWAKYCTDCKTKGRLCQYCKEVNTMPAAKFCDKIKCKICHYTQVDKFDSSRDICKKIIGEKCCICNYDVVINYHHVVFKENGGKDLLTNIIPLCPNHHGEVHLRDLDISEYHKKILQRIEDIKNGVIVL